MSGPFVVAYGVLYGLGFLFLHSFRNDEGFYRSYQADPDLERGGKVVIGGDLLEPFNQQDRKENRFLEVFEMSRVATRLLIASILVVLLNLFLRIDHSEGDFLVHTPSVFVLFIILNSFYIGHLYLALLVNLVLVLTSFQPDSGLVFYCLYVLFVFCSIYVLGKRCLPSKKSFFSLCFLTFLTFVLSWFFYSHFNHPFLKPSLTLELDLEKSRPLRDFLQKQIFEMNREGSGGEDLEKSELLSQMQRLEKIARKEKISESERQFVQQQGPEVFDKLARFPPPQGHGASNEFKLSGQEMDVMNSLALNQPGFQNNQSPRLDTSQSDGDGESTAGVGTMQVDNKDNLSPLSDLEKNTLSSILEKTKENPLQRDFTEKLRHTLTKKEVTLQDRRELANLMKSTLSKTSPPPQKGNLQIPDKNQQQNMLSTFDPPKERDWFKVLKRLAPILCFLVIAFFLYYLLKRKKVIKVLTGNPEDLTELKQLWRELRKKKLSPREEVIQGYNFFHEALQKIHYPEHEAPPSCLILQDMQSFNPDLEKATFVITEVFARCFYGGKEVTLDHLVKFRKAISQALRVYQIH